MLGSDHPFDMGCERPVDAVYELNLSLEEQHDVIGDTLVRLLKVR